MSPTEDYPQTIEIDGITYSVQADHNDDGNVEYFNLQDSVGEIIYEFDYETSELTEGLIRELVEEEHAREARNSPQVPEPETDEEILAAVSKQPKEADEKFFGTILDEDYPQYGGLGEEFRAEAIDALRRNYSESQAYQDILLDELADNYED